MAQEAARSITIVPSDEGIPVLVLELAIHILFCLLQGDVHVAIQASQDPWGEISSKGRKTRQITEKL